jgi:hypothetical protein
MRIPASEVYRAFAELDRFSDDQCRMFVASAQRNRRWSRAVAMLGAWLAAGATWAVVGWLWLAVLSAAPLGPGPFLVVGGVSLTILSGALVGLMIRDRWVRWAVGQQIDAARCPACRYSLLGIPPVEGVITCPECGDGRRVADLSLTAAQVAGMAAGQAAPQRRVAPPTSLPDGFWNKYQ